MGNENRWWLKKVYFYNYNYYNVLRTKQKREGASSRLVNQELQCNVTEAKIRNYDLKVNRTNMLEYSGKSCLISKVCIFTACLTVCLYHPHSSTTYIKVQVTERELPFAIILLLFIIAAPELSTHPDLCKEIKTLTAEWMSE